MSGTGRRWRRTAATEFTCVCLVLAGAGGGRLPLSLPGVPVCLALAGAGGGRLPLSLPVCAWYWQALEEDGCHWQFTWCACMSGAGRRWRRTAATEFTCVCLVLAGAGGGRLPGGGQTGRHTPAERAGLAARQAPVRGRRARQGADDRPGAGG